MEIKVGAIPGRNVSQLRDQRAARGKPARHGGAGHEEPGGSGELVRDGAVIVTMGLRYAMSLPVAVTISGIDSLDVLHQNLEIARGFQPLSASEMQAVREACRFDAADGHLELFKTTKKYDGNLGREMHGFPSASELSV
jgi:hypothetical protein